MVYPCRYVLFHILEHLSTEDLTNCLLVCRKFETVAASLLKSPHHKRKFRRLFQNACKTGDIRFAKLLTKYHLVSAEDARSNNNYALHLSCSYGRFKVIQWLVDTFSLTAEDARSNNNFALQMSCRSGHLKVAQWLVETFSLTAEDAIMDDHLALQLSRFYSHHHVVKWLEETFYSNSPQAD